MSYAFKILKFLTLSVMFIGCNDSEGTDAHDPNVIFNEYSRGLASAWSTAKSSSYIPRIFEGDSIQLSSNSELYVFLDTARTIWPSYPDCNSCWKILTDKAKVQIIKIENHIVLIRTMDSGNVLGYVDRKKFEVLAHPNMNEKKAELLEHFENKIGVLMDSLELKYNLNDRQLIETLGESHYEFTGKHGFSF